MTKVIFAILAHKQADVVRDSIASFMHETGHECILFDGGHDEEFSRHVCVDVCPYSTPIRYGRNHVKFHYGVMRYLYESKREYEFVAFVEGDMCLLKPGFYQSLCRTMADSEYMATNFHEIFDSPKRELADWNIGIHFLSKWEKWKAHFGIRYPFGCFNPGQVMRKEYVDRLFEKNLLPEIIASADKSPLPSLEELIWPTLAASYAINPLRNPGSYAIRMGSHSSEELKRYVRDPNVFMIHKMPMEIAVPDREFVRAVWAGRDLDSFSFYPEKDMRPRHFRIISSCVTRAKRNVRSVQYWLADS